AVPGFDLQPREAMLLQIEIRRHAALHAAVLLLDAMAERQPGEIAVQLVGPLVIGADEAARIALRLAAEAHAAMGAAVLDHVDAAVAVAHHDDGALADPGQLEIAGIRNLDLQRDV